MKNCYLCYSKKPSMLTRLFNFVFNMVFFLTLSIGIIFNPMVYKIVSTNKEQITSMVQLANLWILFLAKVANQYVSLGLNIGMKYEIVNRILTMLKPYLKLVWENENVQLMIAWMKEYFAILLNNLHLTVNNAIAFYE